MCIVELFTSAAEWGPTGWHSGAQAESWWRIILHIVKLRIRSREQWATPRAHMPRVVEPWDPTLLRTKSENAFAKFCCVPCQAVKFHIQRYTLKIIAWNHAHWVRYFLHPYLPSRPGWAWRWRYVGKRMQISWAAIWHSAAEERRRWVAALSIILLAHVFTESLRQVPCRCFLHYSCSAIRFSSPSGTVQAQHRELSQRRVVLGVGEGSAVLVVISNLNLIINIYIYIYFNILYYIIYIIILLYYRSIYRYNLPYRYRYLVRIDIIEDRSAPRFRFTSSTSRLYILYLIHLNLPYLI